MRTFRLERFPVSQGGKNELPHGPRAYVYLQCSSKLKCPTKKGVVEVDAITPECVTLQELEYQVDRLIKELQQIKKQGKMFFGKEQR